MLATLNQLEERVLHTLPNIQDESALIDYKNTIVGKDGELTKILK